MVTFIWFIVFGVPSFTSPFFLLSNWSFGGFYYQYSTCLSFHNCSFHFFCYTRCFLNQGFVGAQIPRWWSLWNEVFTHHHPFHIILTFFSISLGVQQRLIATISNLHKAQLSDSFLRILCWRMNPLWAFCHHHPWNVFSWLTARTDSTEN